MGKNKKKGASRIEKASAKREKKIAQRIKKDIGKIGEPEVSTIIAHIESKNKAKIKVTETKIDNPSRRSNFTFVPHPDKDEIILFGGEFHNEGDLDFSNCRWSKVKQGGSLPTARCSLSGTLISGHNKAYLFGGVYDEEHGEDDLTSTFYNDLFMLDMEQSTPTWRIVSVKEQPNKLHSEVSQNSVDLEFPTPRSHSGLAFKHNNLFVYGGLVEKGSKSLTLNDFYSLDVKKLKKWNVICNDDLLKSVNSDSSSDDSMSTEESTSESSESDASSDGQMDTN